MKLYQIKFLKFKIENVKQSFIKFVDQNTECLCPIILTNKMIIELTCENENIFCLLEIDANLISISSNLLLHNLLQIDIEIMKKDEENLSRSVINLDHNLFDLNCFDCK